MMYFAVIANGICAHDPQTVSFFYYCVTNCHKLNDVTQNKFITCQFCGSGVQLRIVLQETELKESARRVLIRKPD